MTSARTALARLRPGLERRPGHTGLRRAVGWALFVMVAIVVLFPTFDVSLQDCLIRATPFVFCGLAVAIPARAGLVNIGGEGQFAFAMVPVTATVLVMGDALGSSVLIPLLVVAGLLGGMVWAGIAALLRATVRLNEALCTLLLNFVAPLVLAYFVFGPWRDKSSFNLPVSKVFPDSARLPTWGLTQLHLGIVLAVVAAVAVWVVLDLSRWGFRARVVGGNPEAARRAGLPGNRIAFVALVVGGALAGLGGMVEVTGVEGVLRPNIGVGFGYIGFLASWLVGHRPLDLLGSSFLLGSISVAGDSLQINAGLPSTSVYVLMAVVLLLVLSVRGVTTRGMG
ncbi:MAG: ral nucleoside transport system permease protein [Solirubrobacteraceae bacterium]|nr:ral nucleoside transport system permease protein [Solirubrobacteraceae bacterium]